MANHSRFTESEQELIDHTEAVLANTNEARCKHNMIGFCRECDIAKEFARLEAGQYPETQFKTVQSKGPKKGSYNSTPRR